MSQMVRRLPVAVGVVLIGLLVASLPAAPAERSCSSASNRALRGTAQGQDLRYVRVQVSVELFDADGDLIGFDGCPLSGAYSKVINLNTDLPDGSGTNDPNGHTKTWDAGTVPANAVEASIEAYPKGPSATDLTRYGRARRHVSLPDTSVDVELPLNCGFSDNGVAGRNGSIAGVLTEDMVGIDGAHRVSAFSLAEDTEAYPMGFGIDSAIPNGEYRIDTLPPDQPYIVFIKTAATAPRVDIWWVRVRPCQVTTLDYVVGKFQDVGGSHQFFDEVAWMYHEGLSAGYAGDVFRPRGSVTRQSVSAWLHRLNDSPPGPFPDTGLSDVPGTTFEHEIEWMVHTDRATGYDDGRFRPTRCVTRQTMVTFLHREVGAPSGPFPPVAFTDVSADHVFGEEIAWAVQEGITTGYQDGTFRGTECVTRQGAAAFLYRMFGDGSAGAVGSAPDAVLLNP